jgi:DNA-binding CsgD family transcriptional regulator
MERGPDDANYDRTHLVRKRGAPKFFISDKDGNVVLCSPDVLSSELFQRGRDVLHSIISAEGEIAETICRGLDAGTMLRVVPLNERSHFAVFFEPISRNSVEAAAKRYDFTKREQDVLALILAGSSTAQIARKLYISEGTVGDHVKSMFRKTGTNRRSELVARVYDNAHDGRSAKQATRILKSRAR